jgi:hypothetical protein
VNRAPQLTWWESAAALCPLAILPVGGFVAMGIAGAFTAINLKLATRLRGLAFASVSLALGGVAWLTWPPLWSCFVRRRRTQHYRRSALAWRTLNVCLLESIRPQKHRGPGRDRNEDQ